MGKKNVGSAETEEKVLSWLLERENPSARYLALRNVVGMKEADAEVGEARGGIRAMKQVTRILEQQEKGGYWGKKESPYLPKYKSTYWTVMLLSRLGLGRDTRIERACEYLFGFQKENGGFIGDLEGITTPCLTGNVLCMLHHFGYGRDSRVRKAVDYLCGTQLPDGGWVCHEWKSHSRDRHGCFQGTIPPLEALMLFGKEREARRGAEFFLAHRLYMADHHGYSLIKPHFLLLGFPTFFYNILRGLRVLSQLGVRDARMDDALEALLAKRTADGRWIAEFVPALRATFDKKGEPSKWVTLEALAVLRGLGRFCTP